MTLLIVARQQMSLSAITLPVEHLIAVQEVMQLRSKPMIPHTAPSCVCRQKFLEKLILGLASILTLLVVLAILSGKTLPAQTLVSQGTKPAQQQKAAAQPAQLQPPTPDAIAVQPAPISPANQPPNPARVSSDTRGLKIEASNSSLNRILQQVAADTGAKLEGLAQDQRVFGTYGPGPRSDVLLKLLDGSGYNVLIIDGRDTAAPLEIVLSARSPAGPQTAANDQNRRNAERLEHEPQPNYSPEPPRPQSVENPFGNGEPPRDPLQYMQEILERQQKIDQQQQQQDQQNNPRQ